MLAHVMGLFEMCVKRNLFNDTRTRSRRERKWDLSRSLVCLFVYIFHVPRERYQLPHAPGGHIREVLESDIKALTICLRKSATMGSRAPSKAAANGPKSSDRSLSLINASAGKPFARAT